MATTATMAYPCRGVPMGRPNMKTMGERQHHDKQNVEHGREPGGFSNGWAPPARQGGELPSGPPAHA